MNRVKRPDPIPGGNLAGGHRYYYDAEQEDAYVKQIINDANYYKDMWMREDERCENLSLECEHLKETIKSNEILINKLTGEKGGGENGG